MSRTEENRKYRKRLKLDLERFNNWNMKARERTDRWRNKNPWYHIAFQGRYAKITPAWADRKKILEIYKKAHEKGLEVDHIIPLNHPLVCGLHVENNLQLLTRGENLQKGNQLSS